jgi:hypothetical protein
MGIMFDSLRELERQDFAGTDSASRVRPQKAMTWLVTMPEVIEFPE